MQRLDVELLLALELDEAHSGPRCRLGDRLGIAIIVLLSLHVGCTYSGDMSLTV